jgi:hypothetical protein
VYLGTGATLTGFTITNGANLFAAGYDGVVDKYAGGGIFCPDATAVVSNCAISGNTAFLYGGGVYRGTLFRCMILNNLTPGEGLSLYGTGGGASFSTMYKCLVSGNTAYVNGGGVDHCTLYNCILSGNRADNGGGTYYSTLYNCLITGNTAVAFVSYPAGNGGGAFAGTLYNCTVTGNAAVGDSAYSYGGGATYAAKLYNCIIYNNSAPQYPNCDTRSIYGCTLSYCCTFPLVAGTGNITNDPGFVNYAGGDLHLVSGSPCHNAGNAAIQNYSPELDGNPRIRNGMIDMGAYEATPAALAGYDAWAVPISNGLTNYTDCATGDGYPNLLKYATGSSPTDADNLARLSIITISNGVALNFNRNTNAMDVTIVVQVTTGLTASNIWTSIATNSLGAWTGTVTPAEDLTHTPANVAFRLLAPITNSLFIRLKVTRP